MADKDINIKSQSKLIGLDSITKTIEHTVVSKFKELTSSLQKELKIELEVPTEITTQKAQLAKQIQRIKSELNDTLKSIQTEFSKDLDKRWQFNKGGKKGTDSKGNPLGLNNTTDLYDIRQYKNQRLKMIKELANITDDKIEVKDSQQFHKLVQNIKAYEAAIRRLRELSKESGTKYQPDEGDLNLEKLFSGYKFSGTQDNNAKAMAKAFVDSYTAALSTELKAKEADYKRITEDYNRAVAKAAQNQDGVGLEYDQKAYEEQVKQRENAEARLSKSAEKLENSIRKEINAYIELEKCLNDPDISNSDFEDIQDDQDKILSKLLNGIKIAKELKLNIQELQQPASELLDVDDVSSFQDFLRAAGKTAGISANKQFLSSDFEEGKAAKEALEEARKKEERDKGNLDSLAKLFIAMRDSALIQDRVDELSVEKIESSISNLQQENETLKQRISKLEGVSQSDQSDVKAGVLTGVSQTSAVASGNPQAQLDIAKFNEAINSSASAMSNLGDVIKSIVDRLGSIDINSIPVIALSAGNTQEAKTQETSIKAEKASAEQKVSNELKTQQSIEKEIEAVEKRRLTILENRRSVQIKLNQDLAEAEQRRQAEKDRTYAEQAFAAARQRLALKESESESAEIVPLKSAEESAAVLSTLKEIVPVLEKADALSKDVFQFESKDAGLKVFAKDVEATAQKVSSQVQKIYDDLMKLYADRPSGGDKKIDRNIAKKIYALDQLKQAGYDTSGWRQNIETIRSDIGFDKFKQTPNFTGATDKLVTNIVRLSDEVEASISKLEQRFEAAKTAAFIEKNALDQYEYLTKNAQRYTTGQLVGDDGQDWEQFSKEYEQRLEYVAQIQEKTEGIVEAEKQYQAVVDKTIGSLDKQNEFDAKALEIARARVAANEAAEELAKKPFNNGFEHADPTSVFNSYNQSLDSYLKQINTINKLETKQGIAGISANEISTLVEAKQKAAELYDVLKSFGPELDADGENWITKMLNEKNLGNLDKWKASFSGLAESMGPLIAENLQDTDAVFQKLQEYVKSFGGGELVDFSWVKRDAKGIDHFAASFKDADGNAKKLNATLTSVGGNLRAVISDGKQSSSSMQEFMSGMERRWRSLLQYLGTFASFYKAIDIFKRGLSIVKELDSAFVELKRISNDSASALEEFRQKQFELADSVGTTSATIINAATEWEHLGYSIKEAQELAETSAVYKNIADGMTSDSEATEDLVSILKAYNFTADQAMDVTDALIATSNNYAVTAADIGNILKRSSAALAMGGNSFEETVALGTAMNEVLQSAEVAGSSLKVLSLRLRSSKTELADMGEETDNLVESTPKLRAQIKALTKGFDILSSDGKTIKSTYEIMKGIAAVWKDMSDVDQAALLELIAGKTRAQGVSALLSNWSQVDKVLQTIAEDEGIALRNNEEKLNTIQGRITRFTNASQKLASDAFNTEAIKSFVSFGTDAINILDEIIKRVGVIPTMVGTVGGIVSAKSGGGPANAFLSAIKNRGESFVSPYTDVTISKAQQSAYNLIVATDGYDGAKKALSDLQEQQIKVLEYMHQNNTGMTQAITALGTAAKTQSTPLARFSATAKDLLSNLGVGVLNAAFTGGITFAISKIIEFGAAVASYKKSLSSMYGEYGKELKDYDKSLNDYKTQIVDLQKIRDSESSSIEQVSQARKDLREIQSKIIEMCGNEADAIDIVTTAIEGQADALDRLGKKKYEDQVDDYSNERNKLQNRAIRTVYGLWDKANGRSSYNTAKQEIQASIEEYTAELGPLFEGLGIPEIQDVFKDFDRGALDNNITGNINDIIPAVEQALEILEGYQVGDNVSREVYDKNERVLNAVLSKVRADRDNSIDLYNMMLRYDLLQDDSVYREANRLAKEAQEKFDAAKNQKQEDAAVESFGNIIQDIQENGGENKERILGLFKDLYPVLYAEAKNWEFESKLKLVVDKDETKGKVQQALDELQKTFGDRTITKETLDNWDDSTHTSEQNAAYSNLVKTLYANGSVQAKSGFEALSNAGMLATDELAGLNDYLNVSGISIDKFYDRVDTSTLKTTKNLRSKFKAALDSVKGKYKDTTDAAVAAWKLVERSENSLSAKTKEVSGEDLTKIESSLSKLKNDVFDSKGNLKTTTLRNKDFVAAFGDIPDYIDPAINALEKFKKVVQTTTDQSEIQKAFDDLATSYIWNLDAMDGLTEADAKYVEGALAQGGVVNASEIVASALAKSRAETALNTIETELNKNGMLELSEANQVMSDAALETINGLVAQENAADGTQKMLANLLIQQMLLNGSTITTEASQEQLRQLATTAGYAKSEIDSLIASMMLQQSMSQMNELKSLGVTSGQMRRYTNVEGEQRAGLIQNKREQQVQASMKKYADLLSQAKTTGPAPPSGSGGGGGGSNKEPSKTDKEWDWIARKAEIIERENSRLRDAVNSEYVILQDAKQNITDFSTAQENLKEAESKLTNFGVDVESDGFKDFLETLDEVKVVNDEMNQMIDDTPGYVLPTGDTFAKVEAENYGELVEAARKYKLALDDVEKAQSKTLDENGRGKLSIIEDLIESDKQQIELYKQLRESYKSEYEGYKKEVLEAFGEDEGPKWIRDIEEGNITPEKWEQLSTYDSNDQQAKDRYESIDRAYKAKKKEEEADDTLHEKMKQLVEDEQERFQIQLNIVKAKQEEVQSLIDQAEHDLDMKDILGEVVTEQDYRNLINLNDDLISSYREQIDILQEQADQLDEGEGAWYDVQSQIRDCESAIRDAVKQQAEWNDTILRMPVENISRFLGLIQNLGQTLKNWLSVNDAKGIAQTAEQIQTSWTTAYDQIADDELGLMKQLEDYEELLENYDLGQDKFSEVDGEIQSARDSVESLVEEMIELNKQLLTLPIDKISEMTEYLDSTLSGLQQVQSDYETTINTVIDLINHQTEKIQDEYDELQKKIEDQIKPLQDQIDALQKANDKRDRQLQIENALYELEKAREQHTVQVIRNGQVRYEADAEAVRNAQQGYDDAQYNKLLGDLQDKIDELNDQLADAEEATNDQVDALNDILKNRWETIMPDTERNRNEEVASQFFMDMFGVSNWKELVLAGKNANGVYADERIYQGTRAGYEQNSVEMRDTQRQIDINNIITESLTRLVEDFQADKINSEQLSAKVSTLMSFVSDGLITGQERLENTLSLGDYSNLGAALKDANRQRDNQMNIFSDNLAIAQENRDQVNELIGRWDDFKVWYDETYQQLYEQYKKIDFIGDTVAKWYDSYEDDDDGSAGYWDGPSNHWEEDHYYGGSGDHETGYYYAANGLEVGSVGSMSSTDKFKAIQALGLKKLDPDEFPAILHLGEGVINPKQQSTMLGNVRQALALGGNGGAVIQMSFGDITLPSVTNGQDFAESLATQFQPAMNQIFQKIFRR